jgi:hypothetical protein
MTEKERILLELSRQRERADGLLKELQEARTRAERLLEENHRRDTFKEVTGASSIETAISSTRKMVETLDKQIQELKIILRPEDAESIRNQGV